MSSEVAGNEVREVSMRIPRIICRLDFISKVMGAMKGFFKQKNEINRFVGMKHYSGRINYSLKFQGWNYFTSL